MGAVEETRKLIQDCLAPELRTLTEQVAGIQKTLDKGFPEIKKDQLDLKRDMLEAIKSSEEKITLKIELASARVRIEQLERRAKEADAPHQ